MTDSVNPVIKQRSPQDCYICCIAMATGLSYEELTDRMADNVLQRICEQGSQGEDLTYMLTLAGFKEGVDYQSVYRHAEKLLGYGCSAEFARTLLWGRRAIVQVKSLNYPGKRHGVYWDGHQLLDPSNMVAHQWDLVEPLYIMIFNEVKR